MYKEQWKNFVNDTNGGLNAKALTDMALSRNDREVDYNEITFASAFESGSCWTYYGMC